MQFLQAEQGLDPFPFYQRMRNLHPVFYQPEKDLWYVFRYAEVEQVLTNFTLFSSVRQPDDPQKPNKASIIAMDPPEHRQFRNLVTQAFTPRAVAQLTERITTIVTEQLERVAATGTMDVIDDVAYPVPVIVIAELLGIPPEDRSLFKRWSDAVISSMSGQEVNMQRLAMNEYLLQIIAQRQEKAQDDLISALLAARIEGQRLTQRELLGFCILLLVAGNETTTNLIGNATLCFEEHPEVMEQVRAEPELLSGAIEEVLRYRSPVQLTGRIAVMDTILGDQHIRAGQRVLAVIGSANRDDAQFPDPDRFDVRRSPNRHLAFGHGIHFCLGAPLARLEAKIALSLLLERFRDIRRVTEVPLERVESRFLYGVKHLPLTFQHHGERTQ